MIDALLQAIELVFELFLDGFLALLAIALVAPLLGVLLVLHRMPLLSLAIPQVAGAGQAAAYFCAGLFAAEGAALVHAPGAGLQFACTLGAVALGMLGLLVFARDRRDIGVHAGVLFLLALAARELLYLESPFEKIFEQSIQQGRLLTVSAGGRNAVLACCAAALLLTIAQWRKLWTSAFDADQASLLGLSPRRALAWTLGLVAIVCALCVPIAGPEAVLTSMLIPPAILRATSRSLAQYATLCVGASVAAAAAAFVLACTEGLDWPPGATLALCQFATSAGLAALTRRRSA